jgi:hypothetical protein
VSNRRMIVALALLLGAGALLGVLLSRRDLPRGSSLAPTPQGWLAARRYLEQRGAEVTILREPFERSGESASDPNAPPGVLVLAFPWQSLALGDPTGAVDDHLRRGGDVVLAYSGDVADNAQRLPVELDWKPARKMRLSPWAWRQDASLEWALTPAVAGLPPVRVWAPRLLPTVPPNAEILYKTPAGRPAVAVFRRLHGRVISMPADLLSNSRLASEGNADLLETLLARCGNVWTFDEFHHGFGVTEVTTSDLHISRSIDLLLLHLALLYALTVVALARRQGPAWREPRPVAGSAAGFLRGMGALHENLGHQREAARRLLARSRELAPGLAVPAELERWAATSAPSSDEDSARFLTFAKLLTRRRRPPGAGPATGERPTRSPATLRET